MPITGQAEVDGALASLGRLTDDPADQVAGLRALSDALAKILDEPRAPGPGADDSPDR